VKVSTVDDEAVCKLIVGSQVRSTLVISSLSDNFKRDSRLSIESLDDELAIEVIAQAAYDEGRSHLATQLLNHEPRAGKQVPLLNSRDLHLLACPMYIDFVCGNLQVF
jgi:hypothetical protein